MDVITVPDGKLTCTILVIIVENTVLQPGRLSDAVADINGRLIDTLLLVCEESCSDGVHVDLRWN